MQKGANFWTTLLLSYHTSDWFNQQNLPKLQVAVYLFILSWCMYTKCIIIFLSLPSLNTSVTLCGKNWKLILPLFMTVVIGWKVFTKRKLPFKIEFKYILFHKLAFHRLKNFSSKNTTVPTWRKYITVTT